MLSETDTLADLTIHTALIVDDHPLFCDALSMTLQSIANIAQIDTVSCLQEAIDHLSGQPHPDLIVLDLTYPMSVGWMG